MPQSQFSQAFFNSALREFTHLYEPLFGLAGNPITLYRFLHQIGWDFDTLFGVDTTRWLEDFQICEQAAKSVLLALQHEENSAIVEDAHAKFKIFVDRLNGLYPTLMDLEVGSTLDDASLEHARALGTDIVQQLCLNYLYHRAPLAFQLGKLLGMIVMKPATVIYPGNDNTRKPIRFPLERPTINWEGFLHPHTNPFAALIYQIDFRRITSLEAFMDEMNRLFRKFHQELYRATGGLGLNGTSVRLDAGGLSITGGQYLPFPDNGDAPLLIQLDRPGTPQLTISPEEWRFSWLPDIAQPDGSVVIFEQDWVKITLLPALENDDQSTAPGLYCYENPEGMLSFEIVGGIGIQFPLDKLVDEAGNSVGAGARGRLLMSAGELTQLSIDEMSVQGNFKFGGAEGLGIQDASLSILGITLPMPESNGFPFGIELAGTLELPDSNGHITVMLSFDRDMIHFVSTAEVHLGNGIWLHPIEVDRPVLEMTAGSDSNYSFQVAALFKVPKEGDGIAEVEVSGSLDLLRASDGSWQIQQFSAAGLASGMDWELPGKILLTDAGVWLSYDPDEKSFAAGISGALTIEESNAEIDLSLQFAFPDLNDPANVQIQSMVEIEQLSLLEQFYCFDLDLELFVRTKENGILSPSGYLRILEAKMGLFSKNAISSLPDEADFHLVIREVRSQLSFNTSGLAFDLSEGQLRLPEIFYADSDGTPGSAAISIGDHPLQIIFDRNTGLHFSGSLHIQQIGLVTDQFATEPPPGIYVESAHLLLPDVQISATAAELSLPQLSQASGSVVIPVNETESLNFTFTDFSWGLDGIPLGTIYLDGNTVIELGGGFILSFIGETPTSTGFSLQQGTNGLEITIMATVRLTLPVAMLTTVDGDTITLEAGGQLTLYPQQERITFQDLSLAFIGNFHLGGADGFLVEDGRIEAVAIENMLAPSASEPFEIALSGTLTLPNGPKGGLNNARFIFSGDPLPQFDLDGISGGTGNMDLAGDYLPLNVQELRLEFDPDKTLPEKLYPLYTTAIITAELTIGDILSGAVEDLMITFDEQGIPHFSVDSLLLMVEGLEMGSFVLGGGLGIGGLNDIPNSLVLAGNLEGNFNGTAIQALAAFGIVDGIPAPLGAALGVQIGGAGIPLWASGFLLVGARGGVSFTGGNADPDDLRSYIIIDDDSGSIESHPRPEPDAVADVAPEEQTDTGRAPQAPEGESLEFPCPDGPCPPPSVGILYEPHPDTTNYPHRIIVKFSSLQQSTVDELLDQAGISIGQLQSMTPEAIGSQLSNTVIELFSTTLPFLADQLETHIRQPMKTLFQGAVERALGEGGSVYDAIVREAYKGLRAPNVTVKLTGIFSYTGIASFLAVEGGVVISPTVQSAGIVGNVLLLGIPVGRLRAFLTMNNELGLPDPAICGDLAFALGPLDLGYLRFNYKYGVDFTNLATTLIQLIGNLGEDVLQIAMAGVDWDLFVANGNDPAQTIGQMETEQLLAFVAQIMRLDFTDEIRDFLLGLFDASWDNYNPQMLLCGSAQPKLFGMPLDGELVGVSAMADKTSFQANFRFSPTGILSTVFSKIFPAIDQMSCSVRMELPDPRPLIAAGLSAQFGKDGMAEFLEDGIIHVVHHLQATVDYELAPLGLKLANGEARLLMPYLEAHPAWPGSSWKRPEDRRRNYPSRIDVLMAALDDDKLGNIFWKGTNEELKQLPALADQKLDQLELHRDYFPHGGMIGSGRLQLPRILTDAPPISLFQQLFTGSVLQRAQAGMQLISEYILTARSVGQLAFYMPAPNPPAGPAAQIQDLVGILKQIQDQGFDPEQMQVPELYPLTEVFMKGFLGEAGEPLTILGVPLGSASIELVPPDEGTEGHFSISAGVPENSWLADFVQSALLELSIRQKPAEPIAKRFEYLRQQLQTARNKTAVLNQLILDLKEEIPKIALIAEINNLQIPKVLKPIFKVDTQGSAGLYAYSYLYDYQAGFTGSDPVARAKNDGGVVLRYQGDFRVAQAFGLSIQAAKADFAIFPHPIGYPGLVLDASVKQVGLPGGLPPIQKAAIAFESAAGNLEPILSSGSLSIEGTIQQQQIRLKLVKKSNDLYLEAKVNLAYRIKGSIGPLYTPDKKIRILDTLKLNTEFSGQFHLVFREGKGTVTVSRTQFSWYGRNWTVPAFSVAVDSSSINWPQLILEKIQAGASSIFGKFLSDPTKWMNALNDKAITLQKQSAAAITRILRALGASLATAAKLLATRFQEVSTVIQALFNEYKVAMLEVLKVLRAAGFSSSQAIADAIFNLYNGKYIDELVSLFKDHWVGWSDPIKTIMSRLLNAGFGLEAIIAALKRAFGSSQLNAIVQAGRTNLGSSVSQLIELVKVLKKVWGSSVQQMEKIVAALKLSYGSSINTMKNIASALIEAWGNSAYQSIARALTLAWSGTYNLINNIADILKTKFSLSHEAVMFALKHCGFGSYDMTAVMRSKFGAIATDVARFLKDHWSKSASQIATRLRDANYAAKYITNALQNLGYSIETVAGILNDHFNLGHETIMEAFKYAGYGSYEMSKVMRSEFKATASTVAGFLKNKWSKNSSQIAARLEDAGYAAKYVANALENLGYSANTVAKRIKENFSSISDYNAMAALKYAGFGSSETTKQMFSVFKASPTTVANFLKDQWGKTYNSVLSIMTGAGYAYNTVVGILNSIF